MKISTEDREPHWVYHLPVIAILIAAYWLVRLPTAPLPLAYYDDGELLYHVLSLLQGKAPYAEDATHHFLGYTIPFLIGAKLLGFSANLIREMAVINQTLCAFGIYLIVRLFVPFRYAVAAALLYITAREPWVLGFYIQYELNTISVWCMYAALLAVHRNSCMLLAASVLIAGFALICDQRTIFLAFIPILAFVLHFRICASPVRRAAALAAAYFVPIVLAAAWLWYRGALDDAIQQTIVFPSRYRRGSLGLIETVRLAGLAMAHLFDTPVLVGAGLIGIGELARRRGDRREDTFRIIISGSFLPALLFPFFGARDLEYYTIPLLLPLAVTAGIAARRFQGSQAVALAFLLILLVQPTLSGVEAIQAVTDGTHASYRGDGAPETVAKLREIMKPGDSLYVWGYRMDPYVYLEKTSHYPYVDNLMIHPDRGIADPSERAQHVDPGAEKRFFDLLDRSLPDYLVIFDREPFSVFGSKADSAVRIKARHAYDPVFNIKRADLLDKQCSFEIFRKR